MKNPRELLLVALIVLTAFFFRTYQLTSVPPGLYPDEAHNGNNASQALEQKDWKVFYPENNGREGLFINIQSLSVAAFGHSAWSLRIVSAIIGTLTVVGLYFLVRKVFNWQIAAISAFLLATSFWHTLFSRIGFRAIMAPFFVVWGFYFFWRGISTARVWNFAVSGLCWGLGMYTYIGFRAMPLALILTLIAYWFSVKKDFSHSQYLHTRFELTRGFAALMLVALLVFIPLGWHFYTNPQDFFGRTSQVSVFATENPLLSLTISTVKTLGMFTFVGDFNGRHNLAGEPLLWWPVGTFFIVGLVRSIFKFRKGWAIHGHFSTAQTMLLSWFVVGLFPVVFSYESLPHALRAIIVAPVVYIFAAEGIWWLYESLEKWYHHRDMHLVKVKTLPGNHTIFHESAVVSTLVIVALLISAGMYNFNKYFAVWAPQELTKLSFHHTETALAERLNQLSRIVPKYVVIDDNSIPSFSYWPIQSVMFLTDTETPEKQRAKSIFYITQHDYATGNYSRAGMIFRLHE